jgi:predicted transcriptional regulator
MGLRDVDVLRELSTGSVNLAEISKKYGVTRQYVHKRVKGLIERGFIVKTSRGRYELTETARSFIKNAPEIKVENFEKTLNLLLKGIEYFLERKTREESTNIGVHFVNYALAAFIAWSLSTIAEASFEMKKKEIERALDVLWSKKLKHVASALAAIMITCSDKEWEFIRGFFETVKLQGLAHAKILDEHYRSSRERRSNYSSSSHMG